jgi:hypothetical protein
VTPNPVSSIYNLGYTWFIPTTGVCLPFSFLAIWEIRNNGGETPWIQAVWSSRYQEPHGKDIQTA